MAQAGNANRRTALLAAAQMYGGRPADVDMVLRAADRMHEWLMAEDEEEGPQDG